MKTLAFYIRLIFMIIKNFKKQVDILVDDSGSNSQGNLSFLKYSLYIMLVFDMDIVIYQGDAVIRIFDEEDVDYFIANFKSNGGTSDLVKNLSKISKKSLFILYSDFILSDSELKLLEKFKCRILVSQHEKNGTSFDQEICYI